MPKIVEYINKSFVARVIFFTLFGSMTVGCEYFPESSFDLASDSRLPKWINIPEGFSRANTTLTMSYYVKPWGSTAIFSLKSEKGASLVKIEASVKGSSPLELKNPPPGFPPGYPSYEIIVVNGITEIIEHRKMEPIFYVTDDPAIWAELGVKKK